MNQSAFRAKVKKPKAKFAFGKYNGKTLKYVAGVDPQYIVWVYNNVAKCYWPEGFLEAYRKAVVQVREVADE